MPRSLSLGQDPLQACMVNQMTEVAKSAQSDKVKGATACNLGGILFWQCAVCRLFQPGRTQVDTDLGRDQSGTRANLDSISKLAEDAGTSTCLQSAVACLVLWQCDRDEAPWALPQVSQLLSTPKIKVGSPLWQPCRAPCTPRRTQIDQSHHIYWARAGQL